jgi:hypothetical protein
MSSMVKWRSGKAVRKTVRVCLGISLIALVLRAWVVKTYSTELSHPEKESLVTLVTRQSWWPKNEQLANEKELAKAT